MKISRASGRRLSLCSGWTAKGKLGLAALQLGLVDEQELEPLQAVGTSALASHQRRLLRLAAPALREGAAGAREGARLPLFVGLPEPAPGSGAPAERLLEPIARQAGAEYRLSSGDEAGTLLGVMSNKIKGSCEFMM